MAQRDHTGDARQLALRNGARRILETMSPQEREAFIVSAWMSHDARWFMAAARTLGLEPAMRLNRTAIHEAARVEARRLVKRLEFPVPESVDEYLLFQEVAIGLLGPDLLDYSATAVGEDTFELRVQRCFAFDNVSRAGIADRYECGILPRITGWFEGLGISGELTPAPERCLKAQGLECRYVAALRFRDSFDK